MISPSSEQIIQNRDSSLLQKTGKLNTVANKEENKEANNGKKQSRPFAPKQIDKKKPA